MSIDGAKRLINQYNQPGSKGGEVYWSREIRNIWSEITKPEAGDQVGADGKKRTLSEGEARLWAELGAGRMSRAGRRYYRQFSQQVDGLRQIPGGGGDDHEALTPPGAKRPVFLNGAGWPVPTQDTHGRPDQKTAEEGFYRLALAVSGAVQSGAELDGLADLTGAEKAALAQNAIAVAKRSVDADGRGIEGLDAAETRQLRSSAFTALWALGQTVSPRGDTARLSRRIHDALVQMVDAEPNAKLGRHMVRVLDREAYRDNLSANQAADVRELFAEKIPQKFDVQNLLDDDGYISWEHICGQGEGFLRSFIQNIVKENVHGARFELKDKDWRGAEFELKFPGDGRGEGGRVKGIRLKVREFGNDMFDSVGQKTGISYGGHSNIGQNQEKSLARAVAQGKKAETPQLIMLDLCAGLDNLDDDLEQLGNVEVLTTFGSSFFWKGDLEDERGEFEGVTRSEGMESLVATFESLSNEEDYEQMRGRVSDAIYHYSHERNPNVAFPTLQDYREVRWAHLDGDDDGRMDSNDVLYNFGLKQARADHANEFVLQDNGRFDEVEGDALKDAVLDLNVATHYNEVMGHNRTVEHKFISNGFFDGAHTHELMRFAPTENHDGKPAFAVTYNHRLAHTSREAMGALTQYNSVMWMSDTGKVRGLSETDAKLMGLTFATFRLAYDGKGRSDDQRIWKQLLQANRLPSDMPYAPLERLVEAEHHDYSGSLEIVNEYKKSLSETTLAALESRDVGRPGGGPPVA